MIWFISLPVTLRSRMCWLLGVSVPNLSVDNGSIRSSRLTPTDQAGAIRFPACQTHLLSSRLYCCSDDLKPERNFSGSQLYFFDRLYVTQMLSTNEPLAVHKFIVVQQCSSRIKLWTRRIKLWTELYSESRVQRHENNSIWKFP
jgi:hypothetical protein